MNSSPVEALHRGLALFDAGAFFDAHEAWEDAWRSSEGPTQALLQGLILLAATYLKIHANVPGGARTLAERSLGTLERVPEGDWGVDVARVRGALRELLQELERGVPCAQLPPPPTLSDPKEET